MWSATPTAQERRRGRANVFCSQARLAERRGCRPRGRIQSTDPAGAEPSGFAKRTLGRRAGCLSGSAVDRVARLSARRRVEPFALRHFGAIRSLGGPVIPMQLEAVLSHAVALFPVLVFLSALRLMDSYKLVPGKRVLVALGFGGAAAALCYSINSPAFHFFQSHGIDYARFGAPVIEELAKGWYWIFLIATARVAFMVDAGICAFATGAGFSLVENFFYLKEKAGQGIAVSTLRGFGTALMHGGVAAIAAMVTIFLSERKGWQGVRLFAPGLLI